MLKTISPADMKRVEMRAMQETAVTGEELMRRAAAHVAEAVRRISRRGLTVCVCGAGNNGGDGLAAMRMLAEADSDFVGECWLLSGMPSPDHERELARLRAKAPQIRIRLIEKEEIPELRPACAIDAMFGTGLSRPLEGGALAMCRLLNAWRENGTAVIAVDIPSGLNGETGEAMGETVTATQTVTFHRPKHGLYLRSGPDFAGSITAGDIGLPAACDDADGYALLEKADLAALLPARKRNTHKGSYGRVLLLVGSRGMAGAAAISATAALRTGAGLVTVACPESILETVQILCPCATCLPLSADEEQAWRQLRERLAWADALGVGCGLGMGAWARTLMERLTAWLSENALPAVIDADGLNLLAEWPDGKGKWLVTPHPAEAGWLLHWETSAVLAQPEKAAHALAERYGAVILKGACSLMCDGAQMALNPYGTPAMAKGGSGDALTGIAAALLAGRAAGAYTMDELSLMQAACALHGLAGEAAAQHSGERGLLATELCEWLGRVPEAETLTDESDEKPPAIALLGRSVTVTVEHPAGLRERERFWQRNCGYVQEILESENRWQDACILSEAQPLEWFEGEVIARLESAEGEYWAVAAKGKRMDAQSIARECEFLGEIRFLEYLH